MDEKLKIFQTDIYASLKEIKSKIDSKVNNTDYEKASNILEERLKQLMQLIYLKSDKM